MIKLRLKLLSKVLLCWKTHGVSSVMKDRYDVWYVGGDVREGNCTLCVESHSFQLHHVNAVLSLRGIDIVCLCTWCIDMKVENGSKNDLRKNKCLGCLTRHVPVGMLKDLFLLSGCRVVCRLSLLWQVENPTGYFLMPSPIPKTKNENGCMVCSWIADCQNQNWQNQCIHIRRKEFTAFMCHHCESICTIRKTRPQLFCVTTEDTSPVILRN